MGKNLPEKGYMDIRSNSRPYQQRDIPSKNIELFSA